jgi:hypothetical protein
MSRHLRTIASTVHTLSKAYLFYVYIKETARRLKPRSNIAPGTRACSLRLHVSARSASARNSNVHYQHNFPNHANANANANATQIHNNPQCQSEQPAAKQEQTDCDTQNYKT